MNYEEFIKLMTMTPDEEDEYIDDSSEEENENEKDGLNFV